MRSQAYSRFGAGYKAVALLNKIIKRLKFPLSATAPSGAGGFQKIKRIALARRESGDVGDLAIQIKIRLANHL